MKSNFYDFTLYQSSSIKSSEFKSELSLEGNNEKRLLIVTRKSDNTDENITLLQKILLAVHHDISNDCLKIAIPEAESIEVQTLIKENRIEKIFIFGISPTDLGFSFLAKLYQKIELNNCTFLFAHSLENLKKNQQFKKALWLELRKVFA